MVRLNRTRADYLEKFQELIDACNIGSRNIEEIFRDLVARSLSLSLSRARAHRNAGPARARAPERGRADDLRYPDAPGAEPDDRGARRGKEGGATAPRSTEQAARPRQGTKGSGSCRRAACDRGRVG